MSELELHGLSFGALRTVNASRVRRWHPGFPLDGWTGADWSNAMNGEAGEAANIVKKLRRQECGLAGTEQVSTAELADEIADTIIYADLLAAFYGIDLGAAVARKFNVVSERQAFPERLALHARYVAEGTALNPSKR